MTDLLNKYRPKHFDEVFGQDSVVRSLEQALKGRLSHTYLFTGPSGVGKTSLARIAAEQLGAAQFDIVEVDAASETGIDDMRAVAEQLKYSPLHGAAKAVIVDEVHALSKPAITSLLKVTEEPPRWGYWFLCTTEPGRVPQALRTRALTYDLKPVPTAELIALLSGIAEAEKYAVAAPVLQLCATEAQGSPRQALANLGVCAGVTDRTEAAKLLKTASESSEAVELARALARGAGWPEIQALLNGLGDVNPESVRHVIRAYMTKLALGAKQEERVGRACEILSLFSEPFLERDGLSPILLACVRLALR